MISPTFHYEQELWQQGYQYVAGLDEVGRGALAGPVVAGAVIFTPAALGFLRRNGALYGLRDSKLLSPKQREKLAPLIKINARAWAVGAVSQKVIDRGGIAAATERAMFLAIKKLDVKPDFHLIDYFCLKEIAPDRQSGVADGDTLVASIAAASVIAKVYRDALMTRFHETYPHYGFDRHKGYGTEFHQEALRRFGPCPLHRLSFLSEITSTPQLTPL